MLRGRLGTARWAGALSMTAKGPRKEAAAARQTEQDSMLVLVGVGAQEAASIASIVERSGDGPFASARVVRLGPAQLGLAMQDALALGAVAVPGDAARAAAAGEAGEAEEAEEAEGAGGGRGRLILMFGAAAIDEDAHEAFLEMLDEEEGDDILLAPAARPAHQQGACVCVCVCARARVCVCVCVCVRAFSRAGAPARENQVHLTLLWAGIHADELVMADIVDSTLQGALLMIVGVHGSFRFTTLALQVLRNA